MQSCVLVHVSSDGLFFSFVVIVLVVFGFCFSVSILVLACNSSFCIYCSFTYYFEVVNCVFSPCYYFSMSLLPSYFRIHVPVTLCWGVSHFSIKAIFQQCLILELLPAMSLS